MSQVLDRRVEARQSGLGMLCSGGVPPGKSRFGMAVEARSRAARYVLVRWCAVWQSWRVLDGALRCDVVGLGLAVKVRPVRAR